MAAKEAAGTKVKAVAEKTKMLTLKAKLEGFDAHSKDEFNGGDDGFLDRYLTIMSTPVLVKTTKALPVPDNWLSDGMRAMYEAQTTDAEVSG
jgi:hypothetical protein